MIYPKCVRCGDELEEYGAILLSPPKLNRLNYEQNVDKYHLCEKCFDVIFFQLVLSKKENK